MRRTLMAATVALLCLSLCSCMPGQSGRLEKAGKIDVLVLEGTYREMGEQYGSLLEEKLNENYDGVVKGMKDIGESFEEMQEFADAVYETYPQKYKEIVQGLAESSGLGLQKAKLLNMQELYVSQALSHWAKEQGVKRQQCSGIATWGDFTSGPLVFGRNYDLGFFNHQYATLVVYNPTDGSVPTASFTFAGCIYVTTGMNSSGVFLELNNGSSSDPSDFVGDRPWAPITLFSFLEQSTSLEQLTAYFEAARPDLSYIVQGADSEGAVSFEWSTSGVKVRQPDQDGLLAATNRFVDPSWGIEYPEDDVDFSVGRRENLLSLAQKNKGTITPEVLMEMIATPLEKGGAFRAPNLTSYQVVAQPETLTMWLRVPEYQDWVEVDLKEYFSDIE